MKNFAMISAMLMMFGCASGADYSAEQPSSSDEQASSGEQGLHGAPEHLQLQKGEAHNSGGGTSGGSPLLNYGGGGILQTNETMAIFWGTTWKDTDEKVTGLDTFFEGFSGSNYAKASTEYYQTVNGTNTNVTATSTYLGHTIDATPAPRRALTTSSAVAEACKVVGGNPDPNALYLIYTSTGAGHVSYCAWHSWGTCSSGKDIQVAYMPNIDGIAGCDPGDTSGLHSQGLAAVANVTAHELSETITDPRGKGWTDASGQENGDKCAWSFSPQNNGLVTFSNGSQWKLQGEWSNAAFTAGNGYNNRSSQPGCIPFN
jgi:hypothetical protein